MAFEGFSFDFRVRGFEPIWPNEGGSCGGIVACQMIGEAGGGLGVLEFGGAKDFAADGGETGIVFD